MSHEKALYQFLLENFPALNTVRDNFSVHRHSSTDNFRIYHSKRYCITSALYIEQDGNGNTFETYTFDDWSDQGFDPITAEQALKLLQDS